MEKHFPFAGSLEFDIAFESLGHRVERKLQLTYQVRPEWRHYDPLYQCLFPEGGDPDDPPSYLYYAGLLTAPQEFPNLLKSVRPVVPEWTEANVLSYPPVLGPAVTATMWHAIESACAETDRARRTANGFPVVESDYEIMTGGPRDPNRYPA
mgnify:FL=1